LEQSETIALLGESRGWTNSIRHHRVLLQTVRKAGTQQIEVKDPLPRPEREINPKKLKASRRHGMEQYAVVPDGISPALRALTRKDDCFDSL
jgi:hypothetical protein